MLSAGPGQPALDASAAEPRLPALSGAPPSCAADGGRARRSATAALARLGSSGALRRGRPQSWERWPVSRTDGPRPFHGARSRPKPGDVLRDPDDVCALPPSATGAWAANVVGVPRSVADASARKLPFAGLFHADDVSLTDERAAPASAGPTPTVPATSSSGGSGGRALQGPLLPSDAPSVHGACPISSSLRSTDGPVARARAHPRPLNGDAERTPLGVPPYPRCAGPSYLVLGRCCGCPRSARCSACCTWSQWA
jgi:hypothetical protein